MNEAVAGFVGQRVKIWQGGSETYYYTEEGVLEKFDYPWLLVRDDTGSPICIPVQTVRMMRLAPGYDSEGGG